MTTPYTLPEPVIAMPYSMDEDYFSETHMHAAYADGFTAGRKAGLQDAASEVLKDLVAEPHTAYQEQYNRLLMATANHIRSLE